VDKQGRWLPQQILSLRELIAPIDVPGLIATLKLLEAQLLSHPRAPAEGCGLRKFIELLHERSYKGAR
jgi:hypothetical protein